MKEKYQNKYRIASHRMPEWDYSGNGVYFITLVTQNRECNLGVIENNKMNLSGFGKIVEGEWLKSFEIRHELYLDEYIIMPNHLHAIVILDKTENKRFIDLHDTFYGIYSAGTHGTHGTHDTHVETHGRASLPSSQSSSQPPKLNRKSQSISSFVAGFKSAVNAKIDDFIDENNLDIPKYNRNNHFFQPNYHDHIIRNYSSYKRIKKYIISNPFKWDNDRFRPDKYPISEGI